MYLLNIKYNSDKLRNILVLFTIKLLRSSKARGIDIIPRGHHSVAFTLLESIGNFLQSNKLDVDSIDPSHFSFVYHSTISYQSSISIHLAVHIALRDALLF